MPMNASHCLRDSQHKIVTARGSCLLRRRRREGRPHSLLGGERRRRRHQRSGVAQTRRSLIGVRLLGDDARIATAVLVEAAEMTE